MKKFYFLFASILLLAGSGCSDDDPTPDPSAPTITDRFDPLFAQELQKRGYIADAARITAAEVKGITTLDVSGKSGAEGTLTSLRGIASFESLKELNCGCNRLTELNLSRNKALTGLKCGSNLLSALDVGANTALTDLDCSDNKITALDLHALTALTALQCGGNGLASLDITANTALKSLGCASNPGKEGVFAVLAWFGDDEIPEGFTTGSWDSDAGKVAIRYRKDDPEFTACFDPLFAQELQKRGYIADAAHISPDEVKPITTLDVSGEQTLDKEGRLVSMRGIEFFENLEELYCCYNLLASLDVSRNKALKILLCYGNELTALDVSANTALVTIDCSSNKLTEFDVSDCTALEILSNGYNQLTEVDLKNNAALQYLMCTSNKLRNLDLTHNPELTKVNCARNLLSRMDVTACKKLAELHCYSNHLASLDLSNNMALTHLYCSGNPGSPEGIFTIYAWFDNDHIPEGLPLPSETWEAYDRKVTIDYEKVEPSNP